MVAISLYRGNLHRVPDIPRRWTMPQRVISIPQFRRLLLKRTRAISRVSSGNPNVRGKDKLDGTDEVEIRVEKPILSLEPSGSTVLPLRSDNGDAKVVEDNEEPDRRANDGAVSKDVLGSLVGGGIGSSGDGRQEEVINKFDGGDDKEARKIDLHTKLHALNERKHYLVQMLKQILNAEEEIKRKSSQPSLSRSPLPQQAEASLDMNRSAKNPPKISVDVCFGDTGGESDATVNHSNQPRQWPSLHTASPSASSIGRNQHGSFQSNMILNAEEEIKRKSSQPSLSRSPLPQQAEASLDMNRSAKNLLKISVDVSFGDTGGESDDAVNRSNQPRQWPSLHAASPLASSIGRNQHGPFQSNMTNTPRGNALCQAPSTSLITGSTGQHGLPAPVCGSQFAASSPSPVASGGVSSIFRDAR